MSTPDHVRQLHERIEAKKANAELSWQRVRPGLSTEAPPAPDKLRTILNQVREELRHMHDNTVVASAGENEPLLPSLPYGKTKDPHQIA